MVLANIKRAFLYSAFLLILASCAPLEYYDVVVVGGGTGGVCAGVQAARLGVKTLIVEETPWLGGMLTSAGVSAIDGNYHLRAGLFGEFVDSLAGRYGGMDALKTGWVSNILFEPSVGNSIFQNIAKKEVQLTVWYEQRVTHIKKGKNWELKIVDNQGNIKNIESRILIDGTELGDVAAYCGVSYDVGMESRTETHEDIAPHEENNIVQDLTYTAIVQDYGEDVTIAQPSDYDPNEFACCCINEHCTSPKEPQRMWPKSSMITYGKLPNDKYMLNWPIEGNDFYANVIDSTEAARQDAFAQAKARTMRFIYFIQHELGYNTFGLAHNEFPTDDHLPLIPYHREARRVHGRVRFTLNDITEPYEQTLPLYRTAIAVGDYPVDQHHTRYHGYETLPNLYYHPIPSYGLPLGALIPEDVENLIIADKAISVSNIVNGTTRLQPVVMQIGQAAGIIAATALKNRVSTTNVSVREVQDVLLWQRGFLLPYLDVPQHAPLFLPLQRIGATGVLRAIGGSKEWKNFTYIRAHDPLNKCELEGILDYFPNSQEFFDFNGEPCTIKALFDLLEHLEKTEKLPQQIKGCNERIWEKLQLQNFDYQRVILRGEAAALLDYCLDIFHKEIEITGQIKR